MHSRSVRIIYHYTWMCRPNLCILYSEIVVERSLYVGVLNFEVMLHRLHLSPGKLCCNYEHIFGVHLVLQNCKHSWDNKLTRRFERNANFGLKMCMWPAAMFVQKKLEKKLTEQSILSAKVMGKVLNLAAVTDAIMSNLALEREFPWFWKSDFEIHAINFTRTIGIRSCQISH